MWSPQMELPGVTEVTISPEIAALTADQLAARMTAVHAARLAEINAFWNLCRTDPAAAEPRCLATPPIVQDLYLLARARQRPPSREAAPVLDQIAMALLGDAALHAVLEADEDSSSEDRAVLLRRRAADFWDDGRLVGLTVCGATQYLVMRYSSEHFYDEEPSHICQLPSGPNWHVDYGTYSCSNQRDFQELNVYLIGLVDVHGEWQDADLDDATRAAVLASVPDTEHLALYGKLEAGIYHQVVLPTFPTSRDNELTQLDARQECLRRAGETPAAQRALVVARTAALRAQHDALRVEARALELRIRETQQQIFEIEAAALEEETGFRRGQAVRHCSSGEAGLLEISGCNSTHFRLVGQYRTLDGELRRGEWLPALGRPRARPG